MNQVETERTLLRLFKPEDLDALAGILGNPQVMKYLEVDCKPVSRGQTEKAIASIIRHWGEHTFGRWAVIYKENNELIGMTGFRSHEDIAELVYVLDEPYWGKGLATEIATAALRWGFAERGFPRVVAMTRPANAASRRVMDKLGMLFRGDTEVYGISCVEYSITKDEFFSKHALG
jgi:ribosomal-protein-alanine N-acetyltransferase